MPQKHFFFRLIHNCIENITLHKEKSREKNYFEWKPKTGEDKWAETLRGRNNSVKNSERKESNIKSGLDEENARYLENQIDLTKEKIKNSIKFLIPNLSSDNSFLNRSQSTKNFVGKNEGSYGNNSSKVLKILCP